MTDVPQRGARPSDIEPFAPAVDLSALGAPWGADREELVARAISRRAASRLAARRRRAAGLLGSVAAWRVPAAAAATLVLALSGALLWRAADAAPDVGSRAAPDAAAARDDVAAAVAGAVGVPAPLARWVDAPGAPPADVVLAAFATDAALRGAAPRGVPGVITW